MQSDPAHAQASHFGAGLLVRLPLHTLAEIVVQQRQVQQLDMFDLAEKRSEAPIDALCHVGQVL